MRKRGRGMPCNWGLVHAQSARKHKRKGHLVVFSHRNGPHAVYEWSKPS